MLLHTPVRILSSRQPFAQLVVRGVLRILIRSWHPHYLGPVVIHASSRLPSKEDVAAWLGDEDFARHFAQQGWMDRGDLKVLPYGAIIGTAQLIEVHLGRDVHEGRAGHLSWRRETADEVAVRDPELGMLKLVKTKKPFLPLPLPDNAYAWVFADPVEFKPITGVDGKKRLWTLEGELEGVIADRERLARKRIWRPAPVNTKRRDKAQRALRERRKEERERLLREVEERVVRRRAIAAIHLRRDVEEQFRVDLHRYVKANAVPSEEGADAMVRVDLRFLGLMGQREVVPFEEMELALRRTIKRSADAQLAARRRERQREDLLKVYETATSEGVTGVKLRERLERALNRALTEEGEDLEFDRRERHPLGEEKAARARARKEERAREEERRLAAEEHEREVARMLFEALTPRQRRALIEAEAEEAALAEVYRLNREQWKAFEAWWKE
ncbi:MAG: hypothetical protein O2973_08190 [Gemmatimonadetes bacterium]|nr:hypothetical protein [Gemmatimonadota bacterium]